MAYYYAYLKRMSELDRCIKVLEGNLAGAVMYGENHIKIGKSDAETILAILKSTKKEITK